ncbi:MAG: MFS transporter, partial [Planctomycetes bacterium]|nr:MFS transporter [Planctomycetota bacterium]
LHAGDPRNGRAADRPSEERVHPNCYILREGIEFKNHSIEVSPAGFLADRFSKRRIIIPAKIAEIFVMALGLVAFLSIDALGFTGLLVVLFLMGMQSAFFGPGKYGILPEMLRERDLPTANGIMMMTTFLAIILGTAIAGVFQHALSRELLWIGSLACIGIAVLGTFTSFIIRKVPAARPDLQFQLSSVTVPPESRKVLASDRRLLLAILASCMFWLVAGVAIQAVNSFGMVQLKIGGLLTSIMTAIIAVGIAIGGVIAGPLCRGRPNPRFVKLGMWGIVLWLAVLSISLPDGRHLLGFGGSLVVLVMVGISAAFFAIPVQVVIQARPPEGLKGRMIAVMNQTNFIAILLSGVIWMAFDRIADGMQWPRSVIFAMIAALMLPVAIFYRLNPGTQIDSADNTSDTG